MEYQKKFLVQSSRQKKNNGNGAHVVESIYGFLSVECMVTEIFPTYQFFLMPKKYLFIPLQPLKKMHQLLVYFQVIFYKNGQPLLNARNKTTPNSYEMFHILREQYFDLFKPHSGENELPTFDTCRNIFDYAGQFYVVIQLYKKKGKVS